MRRYLSLLFSVILLNIVVSLSAQTAESLIYKADSIKNVVGQSDEAYLSALSAAIQQAFGEGNNALANKLRSEHAEIIKQKYGEQSVEYAEDIWRLGNVSEHLGKKYQIECYEKAKEIYDTLDAKQEFPYCQIMWNLYIHSYDEQKLSLAIHYLNEYTKYSKHWVDREWNGTVPISKITYAHGLFLLGVRYYNINSYILSIDAYEECIELLESYNLINQYQHSLLPYKGMVLNYSILNELDKEIAAQKKVAEITKQIFGEVSSEYVEELSYLSKCYYGQSNLNKIKENIHSILSVIKSKNNINGKDFQLDTAYVHYKHEILSYCVAFEDWTGVVNEGKELIEIYEKNKQQNTIQFLQLLEDMIFGYQGSNDCLSAAALLPKYEKIAGVLNQKTTESYYDYLFQKLQILSLLYKVDEADNVVYELISLNKSLWGENSFKSAELEGMIASHYHSMCRYEEAMAHVFKCTEILQSGKCAFEEQADSLIITACVHNIEGDILSSSNPEMAEDILIKAVDEYRLAGGTAYPAVNNLGKLYINEKHDYKKALEFFEQAKNILEEDGDRSSIYYISVLNDMGVCCRHLGMSSYAMTIFELTGQVIERNYGLNHPLYAGLLQNKSTFYAGIHDYRSAIIYGEKAVELLSSIYGVDSKEYAIALQNLANYYLGNGHLDKAKHNLLIAKDILDKLNDVQLILPYTNLLTIYSHEKNWEAFDTTVKKCFALIAKYNIENTDLAAFVAGAIGKSMLAYHNPKAKEYLEYALNVLKQNGNASSADYVGGQVLYYLSLFLDGSYNENTISILLNSYRNLYLSNVAYYNNLEREKLVSSPRLSIIKDIIFSSRNQGEKDGELYEFLLFNKGLLLGTSLSYAKAIYNSGNEELISQYGELVEINRFLSGETISSTEYTMEEARVRASVLEREITLNLRQNGGYTDELSYTYNDVKGSLSDHEMAVEFVSYINYAENCTNYAALVLMNDFEKPVFIKLGKAEEDIEELALLTPDKIYSESAVSKELYDIIWSPIISMSPSVKKIIFSPAGVLNKLAIEQLYNGNERVCEVYDLVRVTSTREICRKTPQYKYTSAVLYGGLKYDEDIDTMIAESRSVRGDGASVSERFRGCTSSTTRKGWDYLPGTLSEVNEVSSIISKGNISHSLYSAEKGNEESFKALSGNRFDILHIATHGFYLPENQALRNVYYTSNPFIDNNTTASISSLYRSGLILSGGNKAWLGESIPNEIEDGILSAVEISNLDLNSCDIVILSACETGLGEITDEGVFGLQRSFKIAGVNTIIMSLWEVDDQATSYMMQNFYKNLVKGKTKREAFFIAQAEVKKKFSDPRYWAAFIMLD